VSVARIDDAIVLDAGALIALERSDSTLWGVLKRAAARKRTVLVPSAALAQAWRGYPGQAMLSRALAQCAIAPFDPLATQIGELCGKAGTSDVCDAHVALIAARRADELWTSDPEDLRALLAALGVTRPIAIVRC
jgi:hypothetical protein